MDHQIGCRGWNLQDHHVRWRVTAVFALAAGFAIDTKNYMLLNALNGKGLNMNDPFVMAAWGNDKGTGDKMLMVGDGNGEFTEALGLSMDGSGFGLGKRSLRYSMIIDDNSLTKLNVEENPGEVAASSAETILGQL